MHPVIVHYADSRKPWTSLATPLASYWWYFCKEAGMWDYWIQKNSKEIVFRSFFEYKETNEKKNNEMINRLRHEKSVIVYGAGKKARNMITELKKAEVNIACVAVSSVLGNPLHIDGIPVIEIDMLDELNKDKPVIISMRDYYWADVVEKLWGKGYIHIISL